MTPEQLTTLRAAVLADPTLSAVGRNDTELARLLNLPTTFVCWRTSVPKDEIMFNGFDWVLVDNLSIGKARIWDWLFDNAQSAINPNKPNVRAGIAECWKGTAAMLAQQTAILGHCKRAATRAEQILASGTGTDATPGSFGFEGQLSINDIGAIWNQE